MIPAALSNFHIFHLVRSTVVSTRSWIWKRTFRHKIFLLHISISDHSCVDFLPASIPGRKTISLPRSTLMFDGLDIPLKTLILFCTQLSLFLSLPQFHHHFPRFSQGFPTPFSAGPTLSTSAAVPCCASKSFMPSSAWVIMPPAQWGPSKRTAFYELDFCWGLSDEILLVWDV